MTVADVELARDALDSREKWIGSLLGVVGAMSEGSEPELPQLYLIPPEPERLPEIQTYRAPGFGSQSA